MSGIYVHVPWCRAICPYCSFNVYAQDEHTPWDGFVDAVARDFSKLQQDASTLVQTLYIGGGTPSRLPAASLARLIRSIGPLARDAEVTCEANPEDVTETWLKQARDAGVTRISVGVQSFTVATARLLGRGHTGPDSAEALQRIRSANFDSWSADLIFAVPGQSLDQLNHDLDQLLALEPPHVSLYGLTFEPNTPFERLRASGRLEPVEDERWREMYDTVVSRLEDDGLERYEVSNFARDGHQSRHNLRYWTGMPYLGLGPGAHGFGTDGSRWVNHADPAHWMAADDPRAHIEYPSPRDAAVDRLISRLRGKHGLPLADLGWPIDPDVVGNLRRQALLDPRTDRLALTHDAFAIADAVVLRLIEAMPEE